MDIVFFMLFPVFIWLFIVIVIVSSVKGNFKKSPGHRSQQSHSSRHQAAQHTGYSKRQPSVKMSTDRPQMQRGLFDMDADLGKKKRKTKKAFGFGTSHGNSDFDRYETKGRLKDFVSGYDRNLKKGGVSQRRARGMQFSHTYDGHEPWDKCLPKEKDPWDKDFYA